MSDITWTAWNGEHAKELVRGRRLVRLATQGFGNLSSQPVVDAFMEIVRRRSPKALCPAAGNGYILLNVPKAAKHDGVLDRVCLDLAAELPALLMEDAAT